VRIENLLLNVAAASNEFGDFLCFETLTLCPIDLRCIERALLNQEEIDWLNDYHHRVREQLAPQLDGAALAWLQQHTHAL
jgi:Xaa-Pro aminopeptidase